MKSRNGTAVDGRAIAEETPVALGGKIGIGDTELVLVGEVPTDKARVLEVVKRSAERRVSTLMHPGR